MNRKRTWLFGRRRACGLFVFFAAIAIAAGCRRAAAPAPAAPRVETFSSGPVTVTLTATPPTVDFSQNMVVAIRVVSPPNVHVRLPSLQDRLSGFTLEGEYDTETPPGTGQRVAERHVSLVPVVHEEHRIAPLAVVYWDASVSTAATNWFATRPIAFDAKPVLPGKPPGDIAGIRGPIRVLPPFKTVLWYLLLACLAAAAVWLAWRLARRLRRKIQLLRMSPRERALAELSDLLAQRLVERDLVQQFYYELTMIIRRYIERAHRVRAPEQTTEEFLLAASRSPQFTPAVLAKLREFLTAADLVKYAAYRPAAPAVDQALGTARGYVETDSAAQADAPSGGTNV